MNKKKVKLKGNLLNLLVFFSTLTLAALKDHKVDPGMTQIWGPGLQPQKFVMPARYFFIQARNSNNKSIPHSIQDDFQISIEAGKNQFSERPCRVWPNILDRKGGSLIVRYKLEEQCSHLTINIKHENKHVGSSPYVINENVLPEDCYCPRNDLQDLLDSWQCGSIPKQLLSDLEPFGTIDWSVMREKVIKQFHKPHSVSICHYVIKNNKLYRKCYGKYVDFNTFSDSILLSIIRKAKLPDLEFFINLGDWPLSLKHLNEKYPILSWCGSTDSFDIVMPTYELTQASLENMGRVMLDMLSVQGNVELPWEEREPKLFWRGRDSNQYRLDLITMAREVPDLFNVSLTNFFFYRDKEDIYGPKTDHVSFFKFSNYKYQLAIDGTVAPYRTPFLLGGGSLVFKPHSKYYEYFYNDLVPNTHYIPVKTDLTDLVDKLLWAKKHDREAKIIAENGRQFANENLLPQHIFCYHMHLLNELNKRIVSKVEILEGMEVVSHKKDVPCDCVGLEKAKDEL
ncbi:protein O-glucosyltransferase 2-like [Anthonomus grandis grandis]|uniref:protein O-glucosyltransferase 2-like n=1 Tax=Anthonomus grandis grandis TaxID=2921223 RepID=UPI00216597A6|nr:protein O-glucosyltransferase 2-like [Anthonomus grandis grandis]